MLALRRLAAPLLAASVLAAAASADVLVVQGPGGPGPYQTIQDAVDAASDGDVVLVRYWSFDGYPGFVVNGKSIDVVGEPAFGTRPSVHGSVRVTNLPAGERVLVSGLDVTGVASTALYAGYGLWAFSNAGHVRVQDCSLTGASNLFQPSDCQGFGDETGWEGVLLNDCADVSFARCAITGGDGLWQKITFSGSCYESGGGDGGHGLQVVNTKVALFDCELLGGTGGDGGSGDPGSIAARGGHGAYVTSGELVESGTRFEGGTGGLYGDALALPFDGGPGGDGIRMETAGVSMLLDGELVGGAGGLSWSFGSPGPDGNTLIGGVTVPILGTARGFACESPHVEATPLQLQLSGEPNDAVFVLVALTDTYQSSIPTISLLHSVLLASNPQVLSIATLGPSGSASPSVPMPALAPGIQSATVPLQAVAVQPDFQIYLGPPVHLVLLDAGI